MLPSPAPPARAASPADVRAAAPRRLAVTAVITSGASVAIMAAVAALGPSAAVPSFPADAPWPPWFSRADPPAALVAVALWAAVLLGTAGLATGLLAARRGWRPRPARLIAGSAVAVLALMVTPPVGSTDMLDYAVYGRITALGHSPYRMTPLELKAAGDPVGAAAPVPWDSVPSVYGPLATGTEWAAAELGGGSAGRTVLWLKAWNGLAYLALVLGLDRLARSDPSCRTRAHLLWSVNPLMLLAVMAGGHVDGLGAAAVCCAALAVRLGRYPGARPRRFLLAGLLAGAAAAIKAPLLLAGGGVAWLARRSPRALAAAGAGALAVLALCYAVAGRPAVAAVAGRAAGSPSVYDPSLLLSRVLGLGLGSGAIDVRTALGSVLLAVIMLRRMPAGPAAWPAVRPVLALLLAWLITTPQQRPWYDAAIFPLLALMPATRLDWIAVGRAAAAGLAQLPGVTYYPELVPRWLSAAAGTISVLVAPLALIAAGLALIWLCASGRWEPRPGPSDAGGLSHDRGDCRRVRRPRPPARP